MEIVCQINLDRYSPHQIIEMCEQGIVTLNEVIESKRAFSCFTDMLHDYIQAKTHEIMLIATEDTIVQVFEVDDQGNKQGKYPVVSMGLKKAKALLDNQAEVALFISDNE